MRIEIVWGQSEGETRLSAFDKALMQAGIHNQNMLTLSSVIPADANITEPGKCTNQYDVGDIIHVVMASISSDRPKTRISAGLGWCQTKTGGLFYETWGEFGEGECADEIKRGLGEMMSIRGWEGEIKMRIVTHEVVRAGNATVAAVYSWD
jgi:arginine decarboxylase